MKIIKPPASYLLAAIVESTDDAILSKDLKGNITSWNGAANKLYGWGEKEILGKSVKMLFPKDRRAEFNKIMFAIKKGKKIDHFDTIRLTKEGETIDVSVTISPVCNNEGKIIGASEIARDISQRKELERQKDNFIAVASHELKTPITTILGFCQILKEYLEKSDDKILNKYFEKLYLNVSRLSNLINELLVVSSIQLGKMELKKEIFEIDNLVREVSFEMLNPGDKHKIEVLGESHKNVLADKFRISQVLSNLISNAMKYSPNRDQIFIRIAERKGMVKVEVEDLGIGISNKNMASVFDKFFQADTRIRDSFSGLGMGLYISNEIIKKHGGGMVVKSIKGKGSKFSFYLPT